MARWPQRLLTSDPMLVTTSSCWPFFMTCTVSSMSLFTTVVNDVVKTDMTYDYRIQQYLRQFACLSWRIKLFCVIFQDQLEIRTTTKRFLCCKKLEVTGNQSGDLIGQFPFREDDNSFKKILNSLHCIFQKSLTTLTSGTIAIRLPSFVSGEMLFPCSRQCVYILKKQHRFIFALNVWSSVNSI